MRRSVLVPALTAVVLGLLPAGPLAAFEGPIRARVRNQTEIALHYDLFLVEGMHVGDASGKSHDAVLRNGEIVFGREMNAVRLAGNGAIAMAELPEDFSPAQRSFTVGALCQPAAPDGVIAAMGDRSNGFSLYLKEGVPHFAVRSNGELTQVVSDRPVMMNQWVHLAGAVDDQGNLWLIINGWPYIDAQGRFLAEPPTEPFAAGADLGTPVGEYSSSMNWQGLLQDIRLYWGVPDRNANRAVWQEWAKLAGCGCGGG